MDPPDGEGPPLRLYMTDLGAARQILDSDPSRCALCEGAANAPATAFAMGVRRLF
jgi:hypothetical protein